MHSLGFSGRNPVGHKFGNGIGNKLLGEGRVEQVHAIVQVGGGGSGIAAIASRNRINAALIVGNAARQGAVVL